MLPALHTTGLYRAALRTARAIARVAPGLLPRTTATVRANLELAFGRADPALVRATYRHFAEALADLLFFRRLFRPERVHEHFRIEGGGLEHYRRGGRGGAVLVTGHFGNWELCAAAFHYLGIPSCPIVRPPDRPWFARRLEGFRRALGQEPIPKGNALPLAMRALRRGAVVVFLNDQAAGRHGIPVPFFGRPARTYTAPAALAKKLGVPLYAGYSTRIGDGIRYRFFSEVVPADGSVEEVTRRLNERLEAYVRARPEQWWWFHKRFKPPRSERQGLEVTPAGVPAAE